MKEIMGDLHTAGKDKPVPGDLTRTFVPGDMTDQTADLTGADVPDAQTEDFGQQEELFEQ